MDLEKDVIKFGEDVKTRLEKLGEELNNLEVEEVTQKKTFFGALATKKNSYSASSKISNRT